jgi:hypothetical protein
MHKVQFLEKQDNEVFRALSAFSSASPAVKNQKKPASFRKTGSKEIIMHLQLG